jgi:hypothetical protein
LKKKSPLQGARGFGFFLFIKNTPKPSGNVPEEFVKKCVFKIFSVHNFNITKK